MSSSLETCSDEVQKLYSFILDELEKDNISMRCMYADTFYFLSKIDPELAGEYRNSAENSEDFWIEDKAWVFEKPHIFGYLEKLEIKSSRKEVRMQEILEAQTIEGKLHPNWGEMGGAMMSVVEEMPESERAEMGVKYWVGNREKLTEGELPYFFELEGHLRAALSLTEYDFFEYQEELKEIISELEELDTKKLFNREERDYGPHFKPASLAIKLISRVHGPNHSTIQEIKSKGSDIIENEEVTLGEDLTAKDASYWLSALCEIGEGPKKSIHLEEWNKLKREQEREKIRPEIHVTQPINSSSEIKKEIEEKVQEMITSAENEILIQSRYIDMFREELVNFCDENPEAEVKVITVPKNRISGERSMFLKNAIDELKVATKGNIKKNEKMHSRLILVDEKKLLVSTSDLTRDQLHDEFNIATFTKDDNSVSKAKKFFEAVWNDSNSF